MKKLILFILLLGSVRAWGQTDPAPASPTAKPVTSYIKGDTLYFYVNGGWQKILNGAKLNNLYAPIPDKIKSGLATTVSGTTATTTSGSWIINTNTYTKGTSTATSIPAQDATLSRFVVIYADTLNAIHSVNGTLSATPDIPATPVSTLAISIISITPTSVTNAPVTGGTVNLTGAQTVNGTKIWNNVQKFNKIFFKTAPSISTGSTLVLSTDSTIKQDTIKRAAISNTITINGVTHSLNNPSFTTSAGAGTVTSFGKIDGFGIISSVTNPTTTPVHTIRIDTTNIASTANLGNYGSKVFNANTYAPKFAGTGYPKYASGTLSYVTSIPNSDLLNSTISGVSLGGALFAHTAGYGITGSNYNGSVPQTWVADTTSSGALVSKTRLTAALATYQRTLTLTTTGSSGAASLVGNTLNIPNYTGTTYTGSNGVIVSGSNITSDTTLLSTHAYVGNYYPKTAGSITATASKLLQRDAQANGFVNNLIIGYTAVTSAGSTTTLTNGSSQFINVTGTSNQTITLPVTSTLAQGWSYTIDATTTGSVTVNSSGGNLVGTVSSGAVTTFFCTLTTGTNAASWTSVGSGTYMLINGNNTATGVNTFTQRIVASGNIITSAANGTALSNFAATGEDGVNGNGFTNSTLIFGGGTQLGWRVLMNGQQNNSIGTSDVYAAYAIGSMPFTTINSSTTKWATSLLIKPPVVTLGTSATLTNSSTVYIDGAPVIGTNKYSLYVASGTTSLNGPLNVAVGQQIGITEGTNGRVGQVALVSGTKAISITGVTTSSRAFISFVSLGGTASTTWQYAGVCTSGTLTITALTNTGTTDSTDTSTINYFVIN